MIHAARLWLAALLAAPIAAWLITGSQTWSWAAGICGGLAIWGTRHAAARRAGNDRR